MDLERLTLCPEDPLVDMDQCKRDAVLMEELGANVIRIYHVDPNADHDGCMSALDDAGIYTLIDLDTFNTQILPVSTYPDNRLLFSALCLDCWHRFLMCGTAARRGHSVPHGNFLKGPHKRSLV